MSSCVFHEENKDRQWYNVCWLQMVGMGSHEVLSRSLSRCRIVNYLVLMMTLGTTSTQAFVVQHICAESSLTSPPITQLIERTELNICVTLCHELVKLLTWEMNRPNIQALC